MTLEGINWLAVIAAAIVYFGLGALWYSPFLFGNLFMKYRGLTAEELQAAQGPPIEYLFTFIGNLLMVLVLAMIIRLAAASALLDGVVVGVVMAVGIAITSTFIYNIFAGPHRALWAIYSGYQLVAFAIAGAILALWV
jgi:hypothetical protein